MTNIDISPEAVEHLCTIHEGYEQHGTVATLRALSTALTQSRAETAAAYEVAAKAAMGHCYAIMSATDADARAALIAVSIRALATPDQSSALAAVIAEAKAEALSGPWEDKPDALTDAVYAAHPVFTKDYRTYTDALELVSNRHGKGALVGLVNYLMAQNKAAEARGMRKAAELALQRKGDGTATLDHPYDKGYLAACDACAAAILALIGEKK